MESAMPSGPIGKRLQAVGEKTPSVEDIVGTTRTPLSETPINNAVHAAAEASQKRAETNPMPVTETNEEKIINSATSQAEAAAQKAQATGSSVEYKKTGRMYEGLQRLRQYLKRTKV